MTRDLFEALAEVHERITDAGHLLVCTDYDGALAPIVPHPDDAFLPKEMSDVLRSLARNERASVVVISGRERADLQARVDVPGLVYVGNHGLEISGPGFVYVEPSSLDAGLALEQLTTQLAQRLQSVSGVLVENKGLTASVHYRQVPPEDCEGVRRQVHAALATASHPFVLAAGDKVYEIRPRVYWTKVSALRWIQQKLDREDALVIYLGHDEPDEDAFTELTEAITIKIGEVENTAARYRLTGPKEVLRFLNWLERQIHEDAIPAIR